MIKQIVALLVPVAIVAVLLYDISGTRLYSDAELRAVSERAVALAREQDYEAAHEQFHAIFTVAPEFLPARADHLVVLGWQERHAEMLEAAAALPWRQLPDYALDALARAALHEGNPQLAGRYARQAVTNTPAAERLVRARALARSLLAGGHAAQALSLLDQALAEYPHDVELRVQRRIAALQLGEPGTSLPEFGGDARLRREYADVLLAALARQPSTTLQRKLAQLLDQAPEDPALRASQALALSWRGEHGAALELFATLDLEAAPDTVRRAHAHSALAAGQPERALPWLRRHYRERGGVDDGLLLARTLLDSGRAEEALSVLSPLAQRHPQHAGIILAWAYALEALSHRADAADAFTRVLQLGLDDQAVWDSWLENLAYVPAERPLPGASLAAARATPEAVRRAYLRLLLARGDDAAAERLLVQSGMTQSLRDVLGRAAWQARRGGRYERALAILDLGLRHAPDAREFALGRALVLSERGDVAAADAAFGRLLAAAPRDREVLDAALAHARRHGDTAAQRQLLSRLVEQDARYIGAWLAMLGDRPAATRRESIQALRRVHPDEPRLAVTLAALEHAEGDCPAALAPLASPVRGVSPDQAQTAGFIARDCGDAGLAVAWYRAGLAATPSAAQRIRLRAGLMLAQLSLGREAEAEALYRELDVGSAAAERLEPDVLRALADYASAREHWDAAANHYAALLERLPGDDDAWRGRALALGRAGDTAAALEMAQQRPEAFSGAERAGLYADHAASLMQRGEAVATREALTLLEQALPMAPAASPVGQRLRHDRLIALGLLGRDEDMIAAAGEGEPDYMLPDYVLLALADAHQRRGESELALARIEEVAARGPFDEERQRRLFYALLDADQPRHAEALVRRMAQTAARDWDPQGTAPLPWSMRQAAIVDAWHNRLEAARRQLEHYRRLRPDDTDTALALATVYRWQARPSAALPHYDDAAPGHPIDADVGAAYARWDRREFPAVDRAVDDLRERAPGDTGVRELARDWALAQRPNLVARAMTGRSSGTTFGSRDAEAEAWLYSAPLAYRYRVYAHDRFAWAKFPEGNGRLHRAGVGVDYRGEHFGWRAQVDRSVIHGGGDSGLSLSVDWRPDDHWTWAAEAQSFSRDVPLRAMRAGIDGRSLALSSRYQWHVGHWLQGSVSAVDFSDGNERYALNATHYHQILGASRWMLALRQSLYASSNSAGSNVPYYNPDRDAHLGLGADYVGQLPVQRIRRWQHRLSVGIGPYWQRGFGGAFTWDAEYEHRWQITPALSAHLGTLYRQRTYDGDGEGYWAAHGGLDWRF